MLQIKTAAVQETTRLFVTVDGPVMIERCKPRDQDKGGGYGVQLEGQGFSEYVSSDLEVPVGRYLGARCLGRVGKDRFGRSVWALGALLALKDADGNWQKVVVGSASNGAKAAAGAVAARR